MAGKTYRVAQWATGNIGTHAMKAVVAHPQMELVGLRVYNPDKLGKDAGEIAGLGKTLGVKATDRIEDIISAKPDAVLYMPQYVVMDDVCALLEAGINIVTSITEFHEPEAMDPALRARVEAACQKGQSSVHATGSSPGFISQTLPFALATMVRDIDLYAIDEFADCSSRDSPQMIYEVMGFGKKPSGADDRHTQHIQHSFGHSLGQTARSLGMPIDRVAAAGEVGTARETLKIAAGIIEKGTVAALRFTVGGYRGDKMVMRFRANWYVTKDLEQDWELGDGGWRVQVQGGTPLDVRISFPCSEADYPNISPGFTAHPVVNAVPAVCDASPGIKTGADLIILAQMVV